MRMLGEQIHLREMAIEAQPPGMEAGQAQVELLKQEGTIVLHSAIKASGTEEGEGDFRAGSGRDSSALTCIHSEGVSRWAELRWNPSRKCNSSRRVAEACRAS